MLKLICIKMFEEILIPCSGSGVPLISFFIYIEFIWSSFQANIMKAAFSCLNPALIQMIFYSRFTNNNSKRNFLSAIWCIAQTQNIQTFSSDITIGKFSIGFSHESANGVSFTFNRCISLSFQRKRLRPHLSYYEEKAATIQLYTRVCPIVFRDIYIRISFTALEDIVRTSPR